MSAEESTAAARGQRHGSFNLGDVVTSGVKVLSDEERTRLEEQNKRMVSEFLARKLEADARKHWDLFYKRNLVFPLIEDGHRDYFIYACDLSPRAVELVRQHNLYDERYMRAFPCDITTEEVFGTLGEGSLDIATLIFVLSAIHPEKFGAVVGNIFRLMKPGGMVLFRDYGLYDMAQLRFKPGHKIGENFYMRQDGTRSYYFAEDEIGDLFRGAGFEVVVNSYIHRRTINPKEKIDVPRIFVQSKFRKPSG